MFVQRCIKGVWGGPGGLAGEDHADAERITQGGEGIRCNWWRKEGQPTPEQVEERLRPDGLHDHIHRYAIAGPRTPFISLTAGSVERDRVTSINRLLTAEEVRELHTYTGWSDFQLEGEITAKLLVPSHQIERCEYWDVSLDAAAPLREAFNPRYQPPERVSNLREALGP